MMNPPPPPQPPAVAETDTRFLRYLDLPQDYAPSPTREPFAFLQQHLHQLPQHLAVYFSATVSSRDRTTLPLVRNRRLRYMESAEGQNELWWQRARSRWPLLWERSGTTRDDSSKPGDFVANDERQWVKSGGFLEGRETQVGNLGSLLSEYEAERDGERTRQLRRDQAVRDSMMPQVEEDEEDTDDEVGESEATIAAAEDVPETLDQHRQAFERHVKERLIYGTLDEFDYDTVDWNDGLDADLDRQHEDGWFDEDDEEEPMALDRSGTPDY